MALSSFSLPLNLSRRSFFLTTSIHRLHHRSNSSSSRSIRISSPKSGQMKSSASVNRRGVWISAIGDSKMTGAERVRQKADEYWDESSMPDESRKRYKEIPDPPCRWPWFVGAGIVLYTWRTVLEELCNWYNGALMLLNFAGTMSVSYVQRALGTSISRDVETTLISCHPLTISRILLLLPLIALALILKGYISNESFP